MDANLKYRGRLVSESDIRSIRELIRTHPSASRRRLSALLCESWSWKQANGEPCDMVARGLMLALHRAGEIELPPVRCRPRNNVVERRKPRAVSVDRSDLRASLSEIQPLSIVQVRRTAEEELCDGLIEEHHYLGYTRPVGEHLKHVVFAGDRPIACMAWSSAPRHLGPRDRFIGWSPRARRENVRYLVYNTRFLILPWVRVPHLASHLLGWMARELPSQWALLYGHSIYYLETFVDPARYRGTCYLAANWIRLGLTTGRGKDDQTHKQNRPKREVLGLPLTKRFRELLSEVA